MALNTLRDVFVDQLKDLLHAEKQLVRALPKLAKAATDADLSKAFANHLEETQGQIGRLEEVFAKLGIPAKPKPCEAMKGLIAEGEEILEDRNEGSKAAVDAALIVAAQKVEHYEISAYGSVCAFAELLEEDEIAVLLQDTLDEESQANQKLMELSESINAAALGDDDDEEADEFQEKDEKSSSKKTQKDNGGGRKVVRMR